MKTPKLTRAAFELIAETIANLPLEHVQRHLIACQFADKLQATNPAFQRARFISACKVL